MSYANCLARRPQARFDSLVKAGGGTIVKDVNSYTSVLVCGTVQSAKFVVSRLTRAFPPFRNLRERARLCAPALPLLLPPDLPRAPHSHCDNVMGG